MRLRKKGFVELLLFIALIIWLVEPPSLLTTYGREHNWSAFPLDVPWSESYLVLAFIWFVVNAVVAVVVMLLYTLFVEQEEGDKT